jgi:hypothetical protein
MRSQYYINSFLCYGDEPLIADWGVANSNGVFDILNSKSNGQIFIG